MPRTNSNDERDMGPFYTVFQGERPLKPEADFSVEASEAIVFAKSPMKGDRIQIRVRAGSSWKTWESEAPGNSRRCTLNHVDVIWESETAAEIHNASDARESSR